MWVGEIPWHFISAVTFGLFQVCFLGTDDAHPYLFEASLRMGRLIFI